MKKKIKVLIKTNNIKTEKEYNSIFLEDKNILKYQEEDKTKVTLFLNDNILLRENNEIEMEYTFISNIITDGKVLIKEYNKEVNLGIDTIILNKNNNDFFEVEYKIIDSDDSFYYKVIMED